MTMGRYWCWFGILALGVVAWVSAENSAQAAARSLMARPLTAPAGLAVYQPAEKVEVLVKGDKGEPLANDTLVWSLCNYRNETLDQGQLPFGNSVWSKGVTLTLDGSKYPAGFFYLRLEIKSDGATVPWDGTRPAGFIALGWLPNIAALPLKYADESRFGAQGTNPILSRDPFNPLYTTLGLRWCYRNARLGYVSTEKPYVVMSDEDLKRRIHAPEGKNGLAYILDAHGIPADMLDLPSYVDRQEIAKRPTDRGQCYELRDTAAYEELFRKLADQERRTRELSAPQLSRNYYQIHWEPDWHYRGSDEGFIRHYATAKKALTQADPTAVLLGGNYGCIDVGNAHLKRLFQKGLGKYLDGVVTHLYNTSQGGTGLPQAGVGSPEAAQIDRHCRELRALVDTYVRPGAPILNTEWGQLYRGPSRLAEKPETLREHLAWFLRGHLIALGEGIDSTWFFYTADHGGLTAASRDKGRSGYGFFFNQDPELHPFGARVVSPKPIAMGIAAAVRLLEGTKSLGRLDYFGPNVYAYSFRRGEQLLLLLWAPNEPQTISIDTDAPSVTAFDVMGNARPITATAGRITLALDEQPTYVLGLGPAAVANAGTDALLTGLAGEKINGSLKRTTGTALALEREGKSWALDASLALPQDLGIGIHRLVERDGNGRIVSSRLLEIAPSSRIVRIVEGSNGFEVYYVNASAQARTYDFVGYYNRNEIFREQVKFAAGQSGVLVVPYERFHYDLTENIRLICFSLYDGKGLQDYKATQWAGIPLAKLKDFTKDFGQEAICTKNAPWRGVDDFSVSFRVREENEVLQVDIRVKDDVAFTKPHPQYLWRTDCAMIAVGSDPRGDNDWGILRKFYIRMNADKQAVTGEAEGSPAQILKPTNDFKGTVQRDEQAGLTTYSFAVPLASIDLPATIWKNKRLGLGIAVLDVDTEDDMQNDKHRDMEFIVGVPFFFRSNRTGTVYLESPGRAADK